MQFPGSYANSEPVVGSYASTSSIRDVIVSRTSPASNPGTHALTLSSDNRSQYYANSQPGVPSSYSSGLAGPLDSELAFDEDEEDDLPTPRPGEHETVEEMMWDANPAAMLQQTRPEIRSHDFCVPTGPRPSENTPLLHTTNGDLRRRVSTVSLKPRPVGRSTFRQTVRILAKYKRAYTHTQNSCSTLAPCFSASGCSVNLWPSHMRAGEWEPSSSSSTDT